MPSRYPYFSEEHEMFRDTVRYFVARELVPHVEERDRVEEFIRELFPRMGELGFLGPPDPVSRAWCDVRLNTLAGGTCDAMKEIIERSRGC